MKGITKGILFILSIIITLLVYSDVIFAPSIIKTYDGATQTITISFLGSNLTRIQLIKNEIVSPVVGYAYFDVEPYVSFTTPAAGDVNYNWTFIKIAGNMSLSSYKFEIYDDVIRKNIGNYNTTCNSYNSSVGPVGNCTEIFDHYSDVIVGQAWQPFNFYGTTFTAGKTYHLRLIGKFDKARIGYHSIDWIPTFSGIQINDWAIWSTNWSNVTRVQINNTWRDINPPIDINDSSVTANSTAYTFQFQFNFTPINIINPNLTSLRFLDESNTTELYHWFQNVTINGTSTVWIEVCCRNFTGGNNTAPWLNNTNRTFFIYFGYKNVSFNDNFRAAHMFADEFNYSGGSIDPNIWKNSSATKVGIVNGKVNLTGGTVWDGVMIKTHHNFTRQAGLTGEFQYNLVNEQKNSGSGWGGEYITTGLSSNNASFFTESTGNKADICFDATCGGGQPGYGRLNTDTNYTIRLTIINTTTYNLTYDNGTNSTNTFYTIYDTPYAVPASTLTKWYHDVGGGAAGQGHLFDNIRIFVNRYGTGGGELNYSIMSTENLTVTPVPVDTTPPTMLIDAPANISYNVSNQSLNFRAGDETKLDSCWYSLNQGTNTTLVGCTNTTMLLAGGFNHLRLYDNDSSNNTASAQVNITFDRIPSIDRINITLKQIGVTTNVTLNASISDADSNIKNFSFSSGAIQRVFSNSTLELDLTNVALAINFNLTITDNSGSTSSIPINFTYWNTSIIQNKTNTVDNLTYQVIYNNISIQNNNTARLINLTWNVTSPTGAVKIIGEKGNETNLNGSATRRSEWSVDYLSEILGNESQNTGQTVQANGSIYTYIPLNITNLEPVLFTNINISASIAARCRSAWDDNATVINVSASTNISVYPIGCNNTNIVTIINYNITPINSSIVVNVTYNVQFYLTINNTDALINYSSIFMNSSRIINRSIWDNQTALNFTISYLEPNTTIVLAVNVSNVTVFVGNASVISSAFGASYQKYYYSANITARENETSKARNMSLQILQSSLEHFGGRDPILDSIFVDGTSLGVVLGTDSTNAIVNMTTVHQSGDSLRIGTHLIELTYYFPLSSGSPIGGGGGGGGGGGAAIKSQLNITPVPLLVNIAPNSRITREVTLCNTGATLISAQPIITGDYKNTTNVIYYKKAGLVGLQSITDETLPAAGRVVLEPNICRLAGLEIQAPNQLGKFEVGLSFQDYSTSASADGTVLIDTTNPAAPEIARFELLFIGGSIAVIGYYGMKNNAKKKNKSPRI